jgi:hypothetical protein
LNYYETAVRGWRVAGSQGRAFALSGRGKGEGKGKGEGEGKSKNKGRGKNKDKSKNESGVQSRSNDKGGLGEGLVLIHRKVRGGWAPLHS